MFKLLAKLLSLLVSPKAVKAVEVAGQVVDAADKAVHTAKDLQKKAK